MLPVGATARAALASQMDSASARTHLKLGFGALADFLLGTSETRPWRLFVQREMASPGPAFEILYSQLWKPGVELSAALISRVLGQQAATQEGRLVLGWPDLREERLELVKKAIHDQIDLIAVV
jgi:hypothetical protein